MGFELMFSESAARRLNHSATPAYSKPRLVEIILGNFGGGFA